MKKIKENHRDSYRLCLKNDQCDLTIRQPDLAAPRGYATLKIAIRDLPKMIKAHNAEQVTRSVISTLILM